MFWTLRSNHRAALFLLVALAALSLPIAPASAEGYLYSGPGVTGDLFGRSAVLLEDLNGDGFAELVVGVPGAGGGSGRIHFWWGGAAVTLAADETFAGTGAEGFGWCVANVGDVNNGGKPDLAVGAPYYATNTGRVYLFYGENIALNGLANYDRVLTGAVANGGFGFSIAAAGDFDNDGRDDFVVGAPDPRPLDDSSSNTGRALVIYGATGGPSTDLADALLMVGPAVNSRFGWSVAGVGDFLGGSYPSVAVGAPLHAAFGLQAGAVFVYEGAATPNATVDHTLHSGAANVAYGWFGYSVAAAGDWNTGDSWGDVAVGAPYNRALSSLAGRVEIFYGGSSPVTTGDRYAQGASADDEFGFCVAGVGDVNGSGGDDVIIGAPRNDANATDAGQAYLFPGGSSSMTTPSGLVTWFGSPTTTKANALFGQWVAGGADFDGDAEPDFIVGAPGGQAGEGGALAGYAQLNHSTTGPVANELQRWQADWLADGDAAQVALGFAFAAPASRVTELSLTRNTLDGEGVLRAADQVWNGAPDGVRLAVAADGFRFVDAGPFDLPAGGSLSYDVTAATDDGAVLTLQNLAGPAGSAPVFGLAIAGPRPNPSSAFHAVIGFRALAGDPVQVRVYDLRGRAVRTLFEGSGTGAWEETAWDGRDAKGVGVAAGVYYVLVSSPEGSRVTRMSLVR